MLDQKQIHRELAKNMEQVAQSYFDNKVDYYKPRYVDLQVKFSVDPMTDEVIMAMSCGCKIPQRYIEEPRHMTRDELLQEVLEEKKNVSL